MATWVDNAQDFAVGDDIVLFKRSGTPTTVQRKVLAKSATTVTVADLGVDFPRFSGIKLLNDGSTFQVGLDYLDNAYGGSTDGSDGGTFVEFVSNITGSGSIPKFNSFPDDIVAFDFCQHWFDNDASKQNVLQLVAANQHDDTSLGTSDPGSTKNIIFVTTGNHTVGDKNAAIAETVVHELAHQFNVANTHVDSHTVAVQNHANTDVCIMSYLKPIGNKIPAEFDIDCIYDIRGAADPR